MKSPGRKIAYGFFGLVLAFAAAMCLLPGGVEMKVTPVRGGEPLLAFFLNPGESFTLRYFHSVENAPIWETHSVDAEGVIYVEEERYLKFGAGMGKMPGVGRMVQKGPYEIIEGMHRPVGNFILRIGSPGVDHTLIWRGRMVNLSRIAPHAAVSFTATPIRHFHRLCRTLNPYASTRRWIPEKETE